MSPQPLEQVLGRQVAVDGRHGLAAGGANPPGRNGSDLQLVGLLRREVPVDVDPRPPRQLRFELALFQLLRLLAADPAPPSVDANQHRLPLDQRLTMAFGQAGHPGKPFEIGLCVGRLCRLPRRTGAGVLLGKHNARRPQAQGQHQAPSFYTHEPHWPTSLVFLPLFRVPGTSAGSDPWRIWAQYPSYWNWGLYWRSWQPRHQSPAWAK